MSYSITETLLIAYLTLGSIVAIYTVVFFVFTGITIFKDANEVKSPLRHKISYALVTCVLLPVLYPVFIDDVLSLKKLHQDSKS